MLKYAQKSKNNSPSESNFVTQTQDLPQIPAVKNPLPIEPKATIEIQDKVRQSVSNKDKKALQTEDENTKVGGKRGGLHDIRQSRLLL